MKMNKRIAIQAVITVAVLFLAFFIISIVSDTEAGALERGHAGVTQISDNSNTVIASHYVQSHNVNSEVVWLSAFVLVVLVWSVPFASDYYRKKNAKCRTRKGYRL